MPGVLAQPGWLPGCSRRQQPARTPLRSGYSGGERCWGDTEIHSGGGGRALPSGALEGSPGDQGGVVCEGNDFVAGQAACRPRFICYGKQGVIHLEGFYAVTA